MTADNRREYFRTEIALPARWKILNKRETELVKKGLGKNLLNNSQVPNPIDEYIHQASPGSEEEQILQCMQFINNKLDFVIEQIFLKEKGITPHQGYVVDLSGSGLKFKCDEPIAPGTMIKFNLIMTGSIQYRTEFISRVIRSEKDEEDYLIGASIVEIEEEARDSIVQIVMQKQRLEIRRNRD